MANSAPGSTVRPDAIPAGANSRPALRILTCGSVDDGKSTLIGRLLFEKQMIYADQIDALNRDSRKHGTANDEIDYALLLDGLEAEREQGITIDVAYRHFATDKRSFIVADAPGHEQYTRNMATGASHSDVAIILVDARKGILTQTFRHSIIVSLFGIRRVVLAVNKMDLIGFDQATFERLETQFREFAKPLNFREIFAIPVSARYGDNLTFKSRNTPWFTGRPLLDVLEDIDVESEREAQPFRMAVQWINRPHLDFRGFAGTITSGAIQPGDELVVTGSGRHTRITRIITPGGDLPVAVAGDAVTLTLADDVDIARGDVLAAPKDRPQLADQFSAHLIWMGTEPLLPGRSYLLKIGTQTTPASVTELKHRIDVSTMAPHATKTIALNEVAFCNLATSMPIAFEAYAKNRDMGSFILIDRFTYDTVAAGMISFALRRATNIHRHELTITKGARSSLKGHAPAVLWFTGLSGAGKSTISNQLEIALNKRGIHTALLDGDNLRHGLNRDLGFTPADRVENIRRVGEVAKLMSEAGLVVLCSFISPFRAERQVIRELVADEFFEIFVDAPLQVCIDRDPKGLYKRAISGELQNFTGIQQNYEPPERPEIHLRTGDIDVQTSVKIVIEYLQGRNVI